MYSYGFPSSHDSSPHHRKPRTRRHPHAPTAVATTAALSSLGLLLPHQASAAPAHEARRLLGSHAADRYRGAGPLGGTATLLLSDDPQAFFAQTHLLNRLGGREHALLTEYTRAPRIATARLRPGDLVFFYGDISHVGIYVGGGRMIHAPRPGAYVREDSIYYQPIHGSVRPG
ncbi:C40 family peptidase [Streptomyces sp. ISL-43]|uniref:C40 family peptidase n=1 Tax=Streptomyces sp. ISL-43 TaxID=2819183 RepID=UPI001BE972A2|nr:NlpC/P60 family protein [Streptomyces sp. ISL-43]MBT2445792.1 C40 family peptidase [Streptomyces sp. ISL-43]